MKLELARIPGFRPYGVHHKENDGLGEYSLRFLAYLLDTYGTLIIIWFGR